MDEQRAEIGARIAAVPSNGHDSRWAECRDYIRNQRLSEMTEVVGGLQYRRVNLVPYLGESDLFHEPIHLPESEPFEVGKGSRDRISTKLAKGSLWQSS